jgi:hypothetical protein
LGKTRRRRDFGSGFPGVLAEIEMIWRLGDKRLRGERLGTDRHTILATGIM